MKSRAESEITRAAAEAGEGLHQQRLSVAPRAPEPTHHLHLGLRLAHQGNLEPKGEVLEARTPHRGPGLTAHTTRGGPWTSTSCLKQL